MAMPTNTPATAVSDGSACTDLLRPIATPAVADFGASDNARSPEPADAQGLPFYCLIFGRSFLILERGPRKRAR
jgi:hypothetical protein